MNSESVLSFFKEITKVPRESGHEEQIIAYLQNFASDRSLECKTDEAGNVLIPEHVMPWLESLGTYGFRGPCFFVPMASNLNGFPAWVDENGKLIEKMENNLEK